MRNDESNDIDDLLRLLETRPELAERLKLALFGKDISELPANVDALSRAVRELSAVTGRLAPTLDRLSDRPDVSGGPLGQPYRAIAMKNWWNPS